MPYKVYFADIQRQQTYEHDDQLTLSSSLTFVRARKRCLIFLNNNMRSRGVPRVRAPCVVMYVGSIPFIYKHEEHTGL